MKTPFILAATISLMILVAILMAWPTMYLWNNCLVPAVNGINPVSFWQALGLNILASILFKSSNYTSSKKS